MSYSFDFQEMLTRLVKYLIEGLAVAIVAYLLPANKLSGYDIVLLALVAASVFSILDLLAPSIASGTRTGAGLAAGVGLIGLPL